MSDGRLPHRRRWIRWVVGTFVVLLALAIGWVVIRGIGAANSLQQVSSTATKLKAAIAEADFERAQSAADSIAAQAAQARELTADPIWRGFEFVPWLGPNFTAVREVAEVADDVASDALTPVLDAAGELDLASLGFSGSSIDLAPFAAVQEPLGEAAGVLEKADDQARAIDADATIPVLADAVRQMRSVVTEASGVVGALHGASVLLPSMLGADGPRTYVVAMQNNAEVRSSGGIIGALALVTADDGQIRIVRNASTRDFPALETPLELSETTVSLFDDQPGTYIQNITSILEFPEAGQALATRWTDRFGGTVDGIVAVDAVVAQHLVAATGELTFGPFTATGDTVLGILLSEIYSAVPDPEQQDAVFAQASSALLTATMHAGDPKALLGALSTSADEGRIRIWSAHEDEQTLLAASTLGGELPQDDDTATWVGALFNDTTGGKMDYYATAEFATAIGVCNGEPTTQVRITWTNDAPADAATSLPEYVTAGGHYGVPPGSTRTLIAVYGPQGSALAHIDRDGTEERAQTAEADGRPVVQYSAELSPGDSTTITVEFTGEGAGDRLTELVHTPLVDDPETTREELHCAS